MTTDFKWNRRAQNAIGQAYGTNSKRPETFVKGVYPTHVSRGSGAFLWDTGGKKYLDFICGLGTNLLGYSNERLVTAVSDWLRRGWSHSLATPLEVETAEKLKELFPFADCFKFLKSGSEACNAALKMARAATGRSLVLSDGYHGIGDDFISLSEPALGVPKRTWIKPLELDAIGKDVAAVIIEPVITDWSDERRAWLNDLRDRCTKAGAVLIFDEVITGFRWPKYSVSGMWNIRPDLICIGKAMAGGLPLAAVGGSRDILSGREYFVSSTYAGETLSLAACMATCHALQTNYLPETLWERGQHFLSVFNGLWPEGVTIEGYPSRGVLKGEPLHKALFMQEACKAGLLFGPSWFLSFPAAEQASFVFETLKGVMHRIRSGGVQLEGEMPTSPFAQKVRHGNKAKP